MRFFWPIYIGAAVAGTCGVYVAAPLARPLVAVFRKPADSAVSAPVAPQAAAVLKPVAPSRPELAPPPPKPAPQQIRAAQLDEETPPALNGIYLAQRGEKPGWGVTHQRTSYYTLEGTRVGAVAGGVLLEYRKAHSSSKGGMIECVLYENGTASAPLLVSAKDIFLFTGSFRKLSAKQLKDLVGYYALSGKIALRKTELLQASAAKNPYFTAYNAAHKALMAHIDSAKTLATQRDAATELEKTRIEDRLREMKMTETRLRAEYDVQLQKFRTWKKDHPDAVAQPEKDPSIKAWTGEMAALRPRIPGLAY